MGKNQNTNQAQAAASGALDIGGQALPSAADLSALPEIEDQAGEGAPLLDEPMADNRNPMHASIHQTHEANERFEGEIHDDDLNEDFVPPGQLDAPPPRDGMVQRWVRMNFRGAPDAQNRSRQAQSGWVPRRLDTVPGGLQNRYPAFRHKQMGDIIMQGDLVLCEMPVSRAGKRREYFRKKADRQQSLNDVLAEGPAASGGFQPVTIAERKSTVSRRRPTVQVDGDA